MLPSPSSLHVRTATCNGFATASLRYNREALFCWCVRQSGHLRNRSSNPWESKFREAGSLAQPSPQPSCRWRFRVELRWRRAEPSTADRPCKSGHRRSEVGTISTSSTGQRSIRTSVLILRPSTIRGPASTPDHGRRTSLEALRAFDVGGSTAATSRVILLEGVM